MKGFIGFIREQGVIGLAVGFLMGGAISKVVTSLVEDVINPLVGIVTGAGGSLAMMVLYFGPAEIRWGKFVSITLDFIIIAFIAYVLIKKIGLLEEKKEVKAKK